MIGRAWSGLRRISPSWKDWLYGLIAAILLGGAVSCAASFWENRAFDDVTFIDSFYDSGLAASQFKAAFVDIDDDAFRQWSGQAEVTDRRQIKKLIDYFSDKSPSVIVVDINLSKHTGAQGDDALTDYVRSYDNKVPLVFVTALQKREETPKDATDPKITGTTQALLQPAESIIDEAAKEGNERPIYFASSGYLRDRDGLVRSWLLAEPICDAAHKDRTTILSAELLVRLIVDGQEKPDSFNQWFGKECTHIDQDTKPLVFHAAQSGREITLLLSPKHMRDQIKYSIRWDADHVAAASDPVLHVRAETLVTGLNGEESQRASPDPKSFAGRIVVIGGSNSASRDTYATPLGEMPGAMVLLNAVKSLMEGTQIKEFRKPADFAFGVVISLIVFWILRIFGSEISWIVALSVGIVAIFAASWTLKYHDLWIDPYGIIIGTVADMIREKFFYLWGRARRLGPKGLLAPQEDMDLEPEQRP